MDISLRDKYKNYVIYRNDKGKAYIVVSCEDCGRIRNVLVGKSRAIPLKCITCWNKCQKRRDIIGAAMKGHKTSEETKRKIGDAHRGIKEVVPISEETREKYRIASTGRHLSQEAKNKLSLAHKGKKLSLEHRRKISEVQKGRVSPRKGQKGLQVAWNKGIPCSEEMKLRISNKLKGNKLSLETVAKIVESRKGYCHSQETKDKISKSHMGIHPSDDVRKEHSELMKKKFRNPEWREKQLKVFKCKGQSEESRRKISLASKLHWSDPEYKARVVKKTLQSSAIRPTKPEIIIHKMLDKYFPNQWEYNGDFSANTMINGLVPDFVNKNGEKSVIEVFGDFYHNPKLRKGVTWNRTEEGRIAIFKEMGYKCLIIWEHEIKDYYKVLNRIKEFSK